MLEQAINNVLEETKLASYKITGKGSRTTIVLRFDADILNLQRVKRKFWQHQDLKLEDIIIMYVYINQIKY